MDDYIIKENFPITRLRTGILQVGSVLIVLFVISRYDYLLFHSLTELISASIAIGIFMLTWNSRKYFSNNFYLFIGAAFFSIGIITFFHALSYKGMGVIPGTKTNANLATQLWLANQYLLALTFTAAPFFLKKRLETRTILIGYLTALVVILLSIFDWKIMPLAYIDNTGLTLFKKISDYIIISLFLVALYFFRQKKDFINERSLRLISVVLVFFSISTWFFTLYVGVYDVFNMLGHLFQVLAYYVSYLAIVELGLMRPYHSMFKELNDNRMALRYEKDKLANILDNMADGVYITNSDHDMIYANPALQKDFGPIGRQKCYNYLHNRETVCPWCEDKEVFEGKIKRWEWHYQKTGKTYDLIDSPLITPNGVAKMAIFRDITEQKKAREEIQKSKEQWEKTFDSVPDLIAILDNKHRIVRANKAMLKKLKTSGDKCVGMNCYECVHGTQGPIKNCPHSLTMLDGKEHLAEVEEPNLGGTFLVSTTPLFEKDGKIIGSVHVARDITERKKIEKAKDEFLSLASHQLR
ncbi:MAG TPA: MASE3 domain-containing protein, partial [Patescibacteria group bacterium]|nr:MASE3 domain-containing protein [Patescibacteria group bacterium]